jgi:short-subunit dehydrogenase
MLNVHVLATMTLMHAALPRMIERGSGGIINVSSMAAFIPYPGNAMYSATKALITNLTETLHLELQGTGIRMQALCPGMTRTDFHKKLGLRPEEAYASRGPNRALTAKEVVVASLAALGKNQPICVPGGYNRWRSLAVRKLPRAWVHRIVLALFGADVRR